MIGSIIKEERNKIGISQEQLAEKVGVSRSAVAKWENVFQLCINDGVILGITWYVGLRFGKFSA